MNRSALLLALCLGLGGYAWWHRHQGGGPLMQAPRPADGVLVSAEPAYGGLDFHPEYSAFGRLQYKPTGWIDVTARVLARRDYPAEGRGELLRTDFVLGWGAMSDNRVIDHVAIRQADRGYELLPDGSAPIPPALAWEQSMNISTWSEWRENAAAIDAIRIGDIVHLYGWMLKLLDGKGAEWSGGTGNEPIGHRVFIVNVLKLQVNDQKKFGNWQAAPGT